MILFSNVSPGAAYAHDPDGHGHVYHRAGSFAPGPPSASRVRRRSKIAQDAAGERAMTERFIDEVLLERRPALAILWMGEPDATQHVKPLGSPEHLAVLRQADANAARVVEAVDRLRDKGDEVLLIVCSDHGHQTVSRIVDVEAELVAAGLKESRRVRRRRDADQRHLHPRLRASRSCGQDRGHRRVSGRAATGSTGWCRRRSWRPSARRRTTGWRLPISLKSDDEPNAFGVRGHSYESTPVARQGHAPAAAASTAAWPSYEQMPFLMIDGAGFAAGGVSDRADLAHRHRADDPGAPPAAGRGHGRPSAATAAAQSSLSVIEGLQLSSRILKWRPPFGVSVTVALMPGGSGPTYSGRKRRSRIDSASVFSTWLMAPPMQERLPPPNGR